MAEEQIEILCANCGRFEKSENVLMARGGFEIRCTRCGTVVGRRVTFPNIAPVYPPKKRAGAPA